MKVNDNGTIRNMFPLNIFGSRFAGYYVSREGEIWSTRSTRAGKPLYKMKGSVSKSRSRPGRYEHHQTTNQIAPVRKRRYVTLNHMTFFVDNLVQRARSDARWDKETAAVQESNTNVANNASVSNVGQFIVGRNNAAGQLTVAETPKVHDSEASAKTEAQRLATLNPGMSFVVLRVMASVVTGGVQWTDK